MDKSIKEILKEAKTIAVIGCSNDPKRTSNRIAAYLQNHGYTIIPVHPDYDEVLGEKVYPAVYDVPEDVTIDIVDIFRNSEFTADMIDDILKRVENTGRKTVVWTQIGVSSEEAQGKTEQAGLRYIKDKCMMVEHRKLLGS